MAMRRSAQSAGLLRSAQSAESARSACSALALTIFLGRLWRGPIFTTVLGAVLSSSSSTARNRSSLIKRDITRGVGVFEVGTSEQILWLVEAEVLPRRRTVRGLCS